MNDPGPFFLARVHPDLTSKRIDFFKRRYGEEVLRFASHAAFPLILTRDLVHALFVGYRRDIHGHLLPSTEEPAAEHILSILCESYGLDGSTFYEMKEDVRLVLLAHLQASPEYGLPRLMDLAQFVLDALEDLKQMVPEECPEIVITQRWGALVYLDPSQVVLELAEAIATYIEQEDFSECVRLASLVELLAGPLSNPVLLTYARCLGHGLVGIKRGKRLALSSSPFPTVVKGIALPPLEGILEGRETW